MYFLIVCLSLLASQCHCKSDLLSFIEPCKIDDNDCVLAKTKKIVPLLVKGIPELDIPSTDPLILDDVNGDTGDLKLKFKHMKVYGAGQCEIIKAARITKYRAELKTLCPITAKGKYQMGGKMFFIDVYGSGDFEIKTDKVQLEVSIDIKEQPREDGKQYYKIRKFDYKYLPIEKIYFHFDNLMDGDRAKAEPLEKIIDEAWLDVINGIGKPVIHELMSKTVNVVDKIFYNLNIDEFELQ